MVVRPSLACRTAHKSSTHRASRRLLVQGLPVPHALLLMYGKLALQMLQTSPGQQQVIEVCYKVIEVCFKACKRCKPA